MAKRITITASIFTIALCVTMLFGDAKKMLDEVLVALKA